MTKDARDLPTIPELRKRFQYNPTTGQFFDSRGRGPLEKLHLRTSLHPPRVAWAMYYGQWPTKNLRHINNDTSDNRISNITIARRPLTWPYQDIPTVEIEDIT